MRCEHSWPAAATKDPILARETYTGGDNFCGPTAPLTIAAATHDHPNADMARANDAATHEIDLPVGCILLESGNTPITHDKGVTYGYCTITAVSEFCASVRKG
jgi:hypothetical protein